MSHNILWITIDSMRTYKSSDDRGKINFFDDFCKTAISFENCYCSAPSTVMSVSSMMTAVPAIYHSTNYDHFDKNSLKFDTLPAWFERNQYKSQSIVFFPEGREHLPHLMGDTVRTHWPRGRNQRFWNNEEIYNVFVSALSDCNKNNGNFLYVHFNLRHDPKTEKWVKKSHDLFKNKFNNCIIILTSDHGYPDPKRGILQKEMIYHGHDLLMTEDNVKVPLAISGLGKKFSGRVSNNLSSLIDIAPTIQKIINPNIKSTLNQKFFDSGMDLFSGQRKHVQVYNRYIFQKNQQIKLH